MKKTFLILLLVFIFGVSSVYASVLTFKKDYEGQRVTINFYNGQLDTQSAKIVVTTDGSGTNNFSIDVEAEGPSGGYDKYEIGWARPGERNKYDMPLIFVVHPEDEKPGTGHVKILAGGDEILYLEFAYDGRNIRFGESYKQEPNIDIDNKVIVNPPSETRPSEKQPRENTPVSVVFNIKSIPSDADLYIDGNFVGNTPATVELSFDQHKIVVKKKGYKDWEKDLNVTIKGNFTLLAELEKMSKEEIGEIQRKIVFESGLQHHLKNPHPFDIYIMNSDGSQLKSLTADSENQGRNPSWSPDGKKIVFSSWGPEDECWNIYTMNVDGSELKRITNNSAWDDDPSWSPDGKKIVFTSMQKPLEGGYRGADREIYVMNADGSEVKRLTNNQKEDDAPSWSPDGKKIVFASYRENFTSKIYVMNADGSEQTKLSNTPGNHYNPSWSLDGKRIVFASDRDDPTQSEIYIMNADGSRPIRLTHDPKVPSKEGKIYWRNSTPHWSPDGKKIVFSSARNDGYSKIYVMNADGSGQTMILNTPGNHYNPSWCPNL